MLADWLQDLCARAPAGWIDGAVPVFAPRREEDRAADPYDRDFQPADYYTAVAFGHQPGVWDLAEIDFGHGAAQSLYRTVASYVLETGCVRADGKLLDVGCGVGRTVRDCADAMPGWHFVASDYAYNMCRRARAVLTNAEPIPLPSLARRGFLTATLPSRAPLPNTAVVQANAMDLPFHDRAFDCVTATLVLDRVADPLAVLRECARILKPLGRLILSTPLNFRDRALWMSLGEPGSLIQQMRECGLRIEHAFDELPYRERKDQRGSAEEWRVTVVVASGE